VPPIAPQSERLTPEQVYELDDAFFGSDPLGYFEARTEALIAYADGAQARYDEGLGAAYANKLGVRAPDFLPAATDDARELQVAVEALALRQHAAESLLRLFAALLATRDAKPGEVSIWATIADSRDQVADVLKSIAADAGSRDREVGLLLFLPEPDRANVHNNPLIRKALYILGEWLGHAETVLVRDDIRLAAAHNKAKHGLAIRPRNDMRLDFIRAPKDPPQNGKLPLSAMQDSIPVFDRPVLEYLDRPRGGGKDKHGLELTWLRLDTSSLLAEAFMLATVYGSLFHVAAANYAAPRPASIKVAATYPPLPLGPTPEQLLGQGVTGMRFPITFPPGASAPERGPGLSLNDGTFWSMDGREEQRVTLSED
jgi:hypothetical protein